MVAMPTDANLEVPPRGELVEASQAEKEYGITYSTLRFYWTKGSKEFGKLRAFRQGPRTVLLHRPEVERLRDYLQRIQPLEDS